MPNLDALKVAELRETFALSTLGVQSIRVITIHKLLDEIERLRIDLATAIKVARFYKIEKNWQSPSKGFVLQYDPEPSPVDKDRGAKARTYLNGRK